MQQNIVSAFFNPRFFTCQQCCRFYR